MKKDLIRIFLLCLGLTSVSILLAGCVTLDTLTEAAAAAADVTGVVPGSYVRSGGRVAKAAAKTFESYTPEQEHYVGRAVGARIVARYKTFDDAEANHYVNVLGQAMGAASDRPETFRKRSSSPR